MGTDDIANGAITTEKLADGAVTTPKIANGAVTYEKMAPNSVGMEQISDRSILPRMFHETVETEWLYPILNAKCMMMMKRINDMSIYFSNEIACMKKKLSDITGEPESDICVTITPEVFYSSTCADVIVSVSTNDITYDRVAIYVNDVLRIEKFCTKDFTADMKIKDTSMIRTVVQVMGATYSNVQIVTKVFPFFIGSGLSWDAVVNIENAQAYRGHLYGSYNMHINKDGDRIYVIFPKRLARETIRVDMNGFEIPMNKQVHEDYMVYESLNTYQAGFYNIDITDNCHCVCDCDCDCE